MQIEIRKFLKTFSIVIIVLCTLAILGLVIANFSVIRNTLAPTAPPQRTIILPTPVKATQKPTLAFPTWTPSPTIDIFDQGEPIYGNQIPPVINLPDVSTGNKYLYKDVLVKFKLVAEINRQGYLNLDDLSNNNPSNSDVLLEFFYGTKQPGFFQLFTVNSAKSYYADGRAMDYSSCIAHFPLSGFDYNSYLDQSLRFESGKTYCVLTNEGRIALVNYVQGSLSYNEDGTIADISMKVTVYNKQTIPLLTETGVNTQEPTQEPPTPIPTMCGISWTPSTQQRYSAAGITACQAQTLDKAAQDFINAVANKDKKSVSEMVRYPIGIANSKNYLQIKNQDEFIANYDLFFTDVVTENITQTKVDDSMGGSNSMNFFLSISGGKIVFNSDGMINGISFGGY